MTFPTAYAVRTMERLRPLQALHFNLTRGYTTWLCTWLSRTHSQEDVLFIRFICRLCCFLQKRVVVDSDLSTLVGTALDRLHSG